MKAYVIGTSENEGVSKTTGNAFHIAKLFAALPMVGKGARGMMGTEYQVEASVLRKLDDVPLPVYCELEMQDVMRYGKRQQEIVSVTIVPNDPQRVSPTGSAVAKPV